MKLRLLLAAALLLVVAGVARSAVKATIGPTIAGLGPVVYSIDADSAAHLAQDPGATSLPGRTGQCFTCTVNGQAVAIYLRLTKGTNGLFVDVALDQSPSTLQTRVAALSLASITSSAHPAPTDDAVDTAILAAANGS